MLLGAQQITPDEHHRAFLPSDAGRASDCASAYALDCRQETAADGETLQSINPSRSVREGYPRVH